LSASFPNAKIWTIMIQISKTTNKDIKEFNDKEWAKADMEHYGKKVSWRPKKFILKATENGKIVGTIEFQIRAGVTSIELLIVAKNEREQGVGKKLMQETEKIARKKGSHKIYLITGKDWEAVRFYKALGYQETGELLRHSIKRDFIEFCKFI
jgi:ribosomal protein S18 acetylase RimI-like enzyme